MSTKGKSLMKNNLKLNSLDPYDTTPINLTLSESSHTAGPKSKYVKFPQLASEKILLFERYTTNGVLHHQ